MQSSLPRPRPLRAGSRVPGVSYDLVVLLGWLTLFGVGLKWLVGWPAAPVLPAVMPSWSTVQVWAQSPGASPEGLVSWAAALAWVVWIWTLATVLLRVLVDLADALTRGARWVGSVRLVSDWLTIPLVRRAVDASLAGVLLARVVTQSGIAEASPLNESPVATIVQAQTSGVTQTGVLFSASVVSRGHADEGDHETTDVTHTVRLGDTLSRIALVYYGDPEQAEQIYRANLGRRQPDGRQFNRHALILPGWTLLIPGATHGVVEHRDGARWYVVKQGDSLRAIAAQLLGDEERYRDLFDLNVGRARLGQKGPVLQRPELIWPGLRLRLPADTPMADAPPLAPEAPAAPAEAPDPKLDGTPAETARVTRDDEPGGGIQPAVPIAAPTPAVESVAPALTAAPTVPTAAPAAPTTARTERPPVRLSPEQAALAGAGAAASVMGAGALVVRRRRPAPTPAGRESDVRIAGGFAEADPVEGLARRLARTSDPSTVVATLLGQAYLAVFAEQLSAEQRREVDGVSLAATRHGRTSTTLVLAAPVAARPHLVRGMRAAAERAFGEHVDVDGLVSRDGDVLVRVTWDPRHPVSGRVLELVGPGAAPTLWPAPSLVPLLLLYDRQDFDANWDALSNVLLAAPAGSVEVPLTALVASLASVRRPEDLGLVLLAQPHTLPEDLGRLPHGLLDPVNSADPEAVQRALAAVRQELDRRTEAGATDEPDLLVVIRELCDLEPEEMAMLGSIAAAGPRHRVRLVVASGRPVAEALQRCPFLNELGTRLVLQTKDEVESVALLGIPAAEELGSGGHALLRLESRVPIQGWARLVPADHLARLLSLMGTRSPRVAAPVEIQTELAESAALPGEQLSPQRGPGGAESDDALPPSPPAAIATAVRPPMPWQGSPLLKRLRSAPIRVRCFGARDVWYGDRQLSLGDPELLLLLAAHPVTGIRNEALVDMLWEEEPVDPSAALRKRRHRLRDELRRLVPEVMAEPLPWDMNHGERIVTLNPDVVASDVQEFLELLNCARTLEPADATQAYEAALALHRGDLLDAADMPNFRWMYDGAQIALTLRSDYQLRQREARLHLADLLADGPEGGLARAAELYSSLCAENPEDEHLWTALFRVHERAGSLLGLQGAERRLRAALAELTPGAVDVDTVQLPPKLARLLQEIRLRIGSTRLYDEFRSHSDGQHDATVG
jgi:nucleoid-associated protein YgaU/DNA-binding SARP family transcriptional activator